MDQKFIEIGGVVINTAHIVEIEFRADGSAEMRLSDRSSRCFVGAEAAALARFFAPAGAAAGTLPDGRVSDGGGASGGGASGGGGGPRRE